ncbi:MAG TPA: DUF1192 domain-containing protein [Lichenihabitans sp.]|jgi:uncharacterized small protein (DUF1192 family)|nr:DUF1192 domain-containing protein [Lichenihabitans sp.]
MTRDEDDRALRKPPVRHEIGEVLDTLSVEELGARIALLRGEITRLDNAIMAKQASRSAADAVFKT